MAHSHNHSFVWGLWPLSHNSTTKQLQQWQLSKPKLFTVWSFTEKVCWPLCYRNQTPTILVRKGSFCHYREVLSNTEIAGAWKETTHCWNSLSRFWGMGIGSGMQINIFSCHSFWNQSWALLIFTVKRSIIMTCNHWTIPGRILSSLPVIYYQPSARGLEDNGIYIMQQTLQMLLPRECPVSNFSHQAEPPAYELWGSYIHGVFWSLSSYKDLG